MAKYAIPFVVVKDDEIHYESEVQVSFTKKDIAELEQFVIEHDYSCMFVDIPSAMYDKCCDKAFDTALREFKDLRQPDLGYQMSFYELMPMSLVNALSEEVAEKVLANFPEDYFEDDEEYEEEDNEDVEHEDEDVPQRTESLYMTIKQVYFDQIVAGTKKEEYREIKETTYKKYLAVDENGNPYINLNVFPEEEWDKYPSDMFLSIYNDGKCPLVGRKDLGFLNLAVGYNKVRDTATVEVVDITFEVMKDKLGNDFRFSFDDGGVPVRDVNGEYCFWNAVLHLGNIIEKNIVSKK